MTEVVLLCGVAGAGKTTYARRLEARGYLRVAYDEELWRLGHDSLDASPEALAESDRRVRERVRAAVADGVPVVLDASLSTRAIRDELRSFVMEAGGEPRLVVLDAPYPVLAERMRARAGQVGANAFHFDERQLREYHASFEFPGDDEPHERVAGV